MSFRSAIFKSTKRLRYQRFFVNARHSMRGHIVNNSLCHSTCVRNYGITELISNYISPQCTVLPFLPLMRQSFDHKFPKSSTTNPFSLWRLQSIVLAIRWNCTSTSATAKISSCPIKSIVAKKNNAALFFCYMRITICKRGKRCVKFLSYIFHNQNSLN